MLKLKVNEPLPNIVSSVAELLAMFLLSRYFYHYPSIVALTLTLCLSVAIGVIVYLVVALAEILYHEYRDENI